MEPFRFIGGCRSGNRHKGQHEPKSGHCRIQHIDASFEGGARMWEQGKTIRIYWMHVESIALVGCCSGRSVAGESDRVRG